MDNLDDLKRQLDELMDSDDPDPVKMKDLAMLIKQAKAVPVPAQASAPIVSTPAPMVREDSDISPALQAQIDQVAAQAAKIPGMVKLEQTKKWVWFIGITKDQGAVCEALRNLGFQFAKTKTNERTDGNSVWYWQPPDERGKHKRRSNTSWDRIHNKYGSRNLGDD